MNKKLRDSISVKNAILLKVNNHYVTSASEQHPQSAIEQHPQNGAINRKSILQIKFFPRKLLSSVKKIMKFCFKAILVRMKNYLTNDI